MNNPEISSSTPRIAIKEQAAHCCRGSILSPVVIMKVDGRAVLGICGTLFYYENWTLSFPLMREKDYNFS